MSRVKDIARALIRKIERGRGNDLEPPGGLRERVERTASEVTAPDVSCVEAPCGGANDTYPVADSFPQCLQELSELQKNVE